MRNTLTLVLVVIANFWTCNAITLGNPLVEPDEVLCYNATHTLDFNIGRVSIDNINVTFTTRIYNGRIPAQTIRMKAGYFCNLILQNSLPTNTSEANCTSHSNNLHCPDTTNVHTHGLHVSPNQDDINVTVLPGHSHTYSYTLQEKVMMGTHWYHAHYHGTTTLHTLGGAFGMLIVDPADSYTLPSEIQELYDNAIHLMLFEVFLDPDAKSTYLKSWLAMSNAYPDQTVDPDPMIGIGLPLQFYVVNGQYQPYITANAGKNFLLRILHASGARVMELQPTTGNCSMMILARDGIFHQTPYITVPALGLLQGTRTDVIVNCPTPGVVTFGAVLRPESDSYWQGPTNNNRVFQPRIFDVQVNAGQGPADAFPTSAVTFPDYLADLSSSIPLERSFVTHLAGATLIDDNQGFVVADPTTGVNGIAWQGWETPHYTEHLCPERYYQMILDTGHPYHQHINHFQVYTTNTDLTYIVRPGEWRDVLLGAEGSTGEVMRFRTYDYDGVYILHCHITEHEDAGLMGAFLVSPCDAQIGGTWNLTVDAGELLFKTNQKNLDFTAQITQIYEFTGSLNTLPTEDQTVITSGGFGWAEYDVTNPPYPTLCGSGNQNCFEIIATSQTYDGSVHEISLAIEGGYNSGSSDVVVDVPTSETYSVGPQGLKAAMELTWPTSSSTPSNLGVVIEVDWTYSGVDKDTLQVSILSNPDEENTGVELTVGDTIIAVEFPGELSATYESTSLDISRNFIEDTGKRQYTNGVGHAVFHLLFNNGIPNSTISMDVGIHFSDSPGDGGSSSSSGNILQVSMMTLLATLHFLSITC